MRIAGLLAIAAMAGAGLTSSGYQRPYYEQPRSSGPKNGKTAKRAKQKVARKAEQKNRGKK